MGHARKEKSIQSTNYACKSNSRCLFTISSVGEEMGDQKVETGRDKQCEC